MTQTAMTTTTAEQRLPVATAFDEVARRAKAISQSDIIPEAYRNKPGNCLIAIEMADRMGCAPLQIMQAMFVVHGQPGWSAKWLIATANASRKFTPLRWKFTTDANGTKTGAICYATDKSTGELLEGTKVTLEMAQAEGWTKNSKWKTMTEQMLVYRSAAFWVRMYCPEIAMGLQSVEEIEDVQSTRQQVHARTFSAALGAMPEAQPVALPSGEPKSASAHDAEFDGVDPETGEVTP